MTTLAKALFTHLDVFGVKEIELIKTSRGSSFRGSAVSPTASTITGEAREQHLRNGFGFWEHAVALAIRADAETRRGLFEGAAKHNSNTQQKEVMPLGKFCEGLENGVWNNLPNREMVSLSSRVWTEGAEAYLQMLDLGVSVTEPNAEDAIRDAIQVMGTTGLLVKSGRSFHFYGDSLMTPVEHVKFLARAALMAPLVDSRWVMHQLLDGQSALRISNNLERGEMIPTFIDTI